MFSREKSGGRLTHSLSTVHRYFSVISISMNMHNSLLMQVNLLIQRGEMIAKNTDYSPVSVSNA